MALNAAAGSFTANTTTGNQAISGLSFQPQLVLFFGTGQTAAGNATPNIGFRGAAASSTAQGVIAWASDHNVTTSNSGQSARANACIVLLSNGTPQLNAGTSAVASFVSMNATGFTINWTTASTSAFIVGYLALGGTDITNVSVTRQNHATVSPTTYSVGFQPDALIFLDTGVAASPTETVDAHVNVGFATRNSADLTVQGQWNSTFFDNDAATAPDLSNEQFATQVMTGRGTANTNAQRNQAAVSAFTTTGYTLTYANFTGVGTYFVIAIKGGSWACGVTTQTAGATNPGFTPKALLLTTTGQTADASNTASGDNYGHFFGVSDGTNHRSIGLLERDGTAPSLGNRTISTTAALNIIKTSATPAAAGSVTYAFSGSGFTPTWTGSDATARRIGYLVVGDGVTSTNATATAALVTITGTPFASASLGGATGATALDTTSTTPFTAVGAGDGVTAAALLTATVTSLGATASNATNGQATVTLQTVIASIFGATATGAALRVGTLQTAVMTPLTAAGSAGASTTSSLVSVVLVPFAASATAGALRVVGLVPLTLTPFVASAQGAAVVLPGLQAVIVQPQGSIGTGNAQGTTALGTIFIASLAAVASSASGAVGVTQNVVLLAASLAVAASGTAQGTLGIQGVLMSLLLPTAVGGAVGLSARSSVVLVPSSAVALTVLPARITGTKGRWEGREAAEWLRSGSTGRWRGRWR